MLQTALRHDLSERAAVENAALSGAALHQRDPLLHELGIGRLRFVYGRVIRDRTVGLGQEELTLFRVAHVSVIQVGERDHGSAAHTSRHHALAYLADDVVRVDVAQTPALTLQDAFAREREERAQRLGAGGFAAHRLESRTRRSYEREIELYVFTRVPCRETERERIAPAFFRIGDYMRRELMTALALDLRKLLDVVALNSESYAASLHREIHDVSEIGELRRRDEGAVICTRVALTRRISGKLHEAHRGHDFLLQNRFAQFSVLLFRELAAEILTHERNVAIDSLHPRLSALFALDPARIGAQVYEFSKCIVFEIRAALRRELLHVLRHGTLFLADLRALRAIEDVGLGGGHVVGEHELSLYLVLASLYRRHEILVGTRDAGHLAHYFMCDDLGLLSGPLVGGGHCFVNGGYDLIELERNDPSVALLNARHVFLIYALRCAPSFFWGCFNDPPRGHVLCHAL